MDGEMKGDTSQGDDGTEIPHDHPQEDILMPQKIVSCNAGFLQFENENLAKILEVSQRKYTEDYPVAFLAVIGPPQSGKSFIANLMINCSQNPNNGGWLEDLVSEGRFKEGFHFGSVASSKELFEPSGTSGIYIWPKPYLKENSKRLIWILHYHISRKSQLIEVEEAEMIESLLGLVCSRLLELLNKNGKLLIEKVCSLAIPSPPTEVCGSIIILDVESEKNSPKPSRDDRAKDKILELIKIDRTQLDKFQDINFIQIKKCEAALHDQEGRFKYDAIKPLIKPYKDALRLFLIEVEEIIPKKIQNGENVKLSNISEFLGACVNSVNQLQNNTALKKEKVPIKQLLQIDSKEYEVTVDVRQEVATNVNDQHGQKVKSEDTEPSSTSTTGLNGVVLETDLDEPESNSSQSDTISPKPESMSEMNERETRTEVNDSVPKQIRTPNQDNTFIKNDSEECTKMEVDDDHGTLPARKAISSSDHSSEGNSESLQINDENMEVDPPPKDVHSRDRQKLTDETQRKVEEERRKNEDEEGQKKEQEERRINEEEERRKKQEEEKRESERREKEEETKRLEIEWQQQHEQNVKLFNECLPIAIMQVKKMVPTSSKYCISTLEFNPHTVNNFRNIYNYCFNSILEHNYQNLIPQYLWEDFYNQVDAGSSEECVPFLSIAFEPVCKFNQEIGRQLDLYTYFPPETFTELTNQIAAKYISEEMKHNEGPYECTQLGIQKISECHTATNAAILESEKEFRETVGLQIKNLYNEQMKGYLKKHGAFTRKQLEQIHSELVRRLVDWSKKIVNPTTGNVLPGDAQKWISKLEIELSETFGGHKDSNEIKLKRLQLEVNKLVSRRYEEYVKKMEDILQRNPQGYDQGKLNKVNKALSKEQKNLLIMDIKKTIRDTEPTDGHCDALQHQILQYWETVWSVNDTNLAKTLAENRNQKERQRQQAEMERAGQFHNMANASSSAASYGTRRRTVRKIETVQWKKQLDPLIFRLSRKHISMATTVDGDFHLIPNVNGEMFTPSLVGINENGDLVYGTEAVVQCTSENHERKHWWIVQFLSGNDSSSSKERWSFNVGDQCAFYDIGVEFLLGFLMRSLRESAEKKLEGSFTTAVIAIPFWFCSTQRLQIKDAARVAGFSDVYLVNEESCAAYAVASCQIRASSYGSVLVLSENYGVITAAAYTHFMENNWKKVTMSQFNVCNINAEVERKGGSLFSNVKNKLRDVGNYIWGSTKEKHSGLDMDTKIKLVREVCKSMFEKYKPTDMWPGEAIFITNSNDEWDREWYEIFESVVNDKGYGRISKIPHTGPCSIGLYGASLLSRHLYHLAECLRDSMCHDVQKFCVDSNSSSRAIAADDYRSLPLQRKQHLTELPKGQKKARFFQRNVFDGSDSYIGDLAVGFGVSNTQQIYPIFEINSDATISLIGVECDPAKRGHSTTQKEITKDFTWTTYTISDPKRGDVQKLINQLFEFTTIPMEEADAIPMETETEENEEIKVEMVKLESKCEAMEEGMRNNLYHFKTDVSSELFKKKIEKAKVLLKSSDLTIESLQKELEVLEKACSKYSNK